MIGISLPAKAVLGSIANFRNRFVITGADGFAFIAKSKLNPEHVHAYKLLLGEGDQFKIEPWASDQGHDEEYGIDVTPDWFDLVVNGDGELIQSHRADVGDIFVGSDGRFIVASSPIVEMPKHVNLDNGLAQKPDNAFVVRFRSWELVGYRRDVEAFRITKKSPGTFA
jgi:hypothetical protein